MFKIGISFLFLAISLLPQLSQCQVTNVDEASFIDALIAEAGLPPNGENEESPVVCHCVDKSQCMTDQPTTLSFLGKIDEKINSCGFASQVCCEPHKVICSCVQPAHCVDSFHTDKAHCSQGEVCCSNVQVSEIPGPGPGQEQDKISCGASHKIVKKTIFGTAANERDYPWFVAIIGPDQQYSFAGSLIHPQMILTVAHQADEYTFRDITIKIGNADLSKRSNQVKGVREIIHHPEFNPSLLHNDLALLILDSPVDIFLGIATLCLPVNNENYDRSSCYSGGWGKDETDPTSVAGELLKYVEVPIIDHLACENALQQAKLGSMFELHNSFICAGGGASDTCVGDGGSPLFCKIPGTQQNVQIGVTAWGIGCGTEGVPGVYAALDQNGVSWITQVARSKFGDDATQYFTA